MMLDPQIATLATLDDGGRIHDVVRRAEEEPARAEAAEADLPRMRALDPRAPLPRPLAT